MSIVKSLSPDLVRSTRLPVETGRNRKKQEVKSQFPMRTSALSDVKAGEVASMEH